MTIFDPIFGSEDRVWEGVLRSSGSKKEDGGSSKMEGACFEDREVLRRTLPMGGGSSSKNPFQSSNNPQSSKNPPSSKNIHLRSSEPKIEDLPSSIFGAEDRRSPRGFFEDRGVLRSSGSEERRAPTIFHPLGPKNGEPLPHFPPSRPEEQRTFTHFPFLDQKNEEPSPICSSSDPLPSNRGHQLLSAILRFGFSERSSTLKIGPKIEIGFYVLSKIEVDRWFFSDMPYISFFTETLKQTLVSNEERSALVVLRRNRWRLAVPPCAAPFRPARGMPEFVIRFF